MNLLLHTCCAPCLLFPVDVLKHEKIKVTVYFYNPNIHPYQEYKRRLKTLVEFSDKNNFSLVVHQGYGFEDFSRKVVFNEKNRCSICYDMRLKKTVAYVEENRFDSFSFTLLYSKYQNHSLIRDKCQKLATQYNVAFFYRDFREGWQKGIDSSIVENLYRQPYCGCIYSEQERYDNRLKKQLRKQRKKMT